MTKISPANISRKTTNPPDNSVTGCNTTEEPVTASDSKDLEAVPVQNNGSTLDMLNLKKTQPIELQTALKKLATDPQSITLADFMVMNNAGLQEAMTKLIGVEIVSPAGSYTIPQERRKEAIEANRLKGLQHAEHMRKTTEIIGREQQSSSTKFTIKKVQLENGKIALALSIDGEPWAFQPKEKDTNGIDDIFSDFLSAHDILRHNALNRDRTSNLTTPMGEYGTGQVGLPRTMLPAVPMFYEGLIANAADAILEKETKGSFPFKKLGEIITEFRTNGDIPVGSSIDIEIEFPPADIEWKQTGTGEKTYYLLGEETYNGKISPKKASEYEKTLINSERFSHSEKEVGATKVINTETNEAISSIVTVHTFTEKVPQEGKKLREQYQITKNPQGQILEARKCWIDNENKEISWVEGNLINKGLRHTYADSSTATKLYQTKKPSGREVAYFFTDNSGVILFLDSSKDKYKAFYTGQPYQSPRITSINIKDIKDSPIDTKNDMCTSRLQKMIPKFKELFAKYQKIMEDILESGILPLDVNLGVTSYSVNSLFRTYERLVNKKLLSPDDPITIETIQEALFKDFKNTTQAEGAPGLMQDEEFTIAPFPPPPFRTNQA